MALLSAEHLAGPGYIILNILRVINIITLSSVVASSVVMLVKTFIVSKFFFFDATSHVVTALAGMFLVVSECSLFRGYFARSWPLLSPSHGFVALGCSMAVLGLNMLGNMNKEATSQKSLGLPFWRLLLASGILAIVIGFFNVVASFVFRDKARHITARRVRSKGAITLTEEPPMDWETDSKLKAFTISTHHTGTTNRTCSPMMRTGTPPRIGTPPVDMGSPQPNVASPQNDHRFSQFDFNPIRAFRNARQSILPSYHSTSPAKPTLQGHHRRSSSLYSRSTSGQTKRSFWLKRRDSDVPDVPHVPEISAPLNVNPQFAHLVKPNLAHHPSVRRPEADFDKI
ncbi:uncharacterized protein N0V89_002213 [Didymosphaeria variabile]|uniref:DUF7598 domain-containing protein n=1 Tax=Didymosphaeria variabile TaxID=1932322 RepID=A0A9W9CE56_9PLEO|nr:uncharacterized protein N0V89_002213 [Didymosphaeria variabile]KAJ4357637.1 hypothetical protein N0V89_002213 [Didymosphaeria variabile]